MILIELHTTYKDNCMQSKAFVIKSPCVLQYINIIIKDRIWTINILNLIQVLQMHEFKDEYYYKPKLRKSALVSHPHVEGWGDVLIHKTK